MWYVGNSLQGIRDSLSHDPLIPRLQSPTFNLPTVYHIPMPDFVRVAKFDDLADPGRELVEVDDRVVVLLRVGGEVFALDDVCTHDGGPLSEGEMEDHTIACPRHGAKFDIRDGRALTMPATRPTVAHQVKVEGGEIFVKLND